MVPAENAQEQRAVVVLKAFVLCLSPLLYGLRVNPFKDLNGSRRECGGAGSCCGSKYFRTRSLAPLLCSLRVNPLTDLSDMKSEGPGFRDLRVNDTLESRSSCFENPVPVLQLK